MPQNGQDSQQSLFVSVIPTAKNGLNNSGPKSPSSPKSKTLHGPNQLPLLRGDSHASRFPLRDEKEERRIIAISGRRCLESYPKSGQLGSLLKTLLTSEIWFSPIAKMIWRPRIMKRSRLIFQLALVDYQQWNGTSGLLPRCEASSWKSASRNAYRGSGKYAHASGGRIVMKLRDSPQSPIYLSLHFAEAVKGFPIGWTDIKLSEMQSPRKSHTKSSRGLP